MEFRHKRESTTAGRSAAGAAPSGWTACNPRGRARRWRLDLKLRFWAEVDRVAPPATIFASNSSGFSIAGLAAVTGRADRMIGWHWASPAPIMKLAEIVRGPETSDATTDTVVRLAAGAGKNPIVVKDTTRAWGYVANRIYSAMAREASGRVAGSRPPPPLH